MKKKKFNVEGTVLTNIFARGIEAESQEDAIKKFKEKLESCDFVDWTDWHDIEVSEVVDYSERVNKVLKKMGLDSQYKVLDIPEIVYDYDSFSLFSVNFKVLNQKGEQIATSGDVFFIVFPNGGGLFLPIKQSCFGNDISFNYMKESKDVPFEKNLTKVLFTDGEDVLAYVPTKSNGFFTMYVQKGVSTSLGKRFDYIVKKTGMEGLYVTKSSDYDLELTSSDRKIDLSASYKSENDYIPERLTKIEAII